MAREILVNVADSEPDPTFWSAWGMEVCALRDRFVAELDADDPFAYDEAASVSLLSNAAARIGALSLCDYREQKHHASAPDQECSGRIDLYVLYNGIGMAFEAKPVYTFRKSDIENDKKDALACAGQITTEREYDAIYGLVIANHSYDKGNLSEHINLVKQIMKGSHIAWHLYGSECVKPTHIYFIRLDSR